MIQKANTNTGYHNDSTFTGETGDGLEGKAQSPTGEAA